jgi:hypothetical protein
VTSTLAPAARRRPFRRKLHRGVAVVGWMGNAVILAALLVLGAAAGALADGVPAGIPTVTATYER